MRESLWAIAIDGKQRVIAVRTLHPRRFIREPGAAFILEIPHAFTPPSVGTTLSWITT